MSSSYQTKIGDGSSENPLDLSVKRSEMDSHFYSNSLPSLSPNHTAIAVRIPQNVYDISTSTINSSTPPTAECSTNNCSYYTNIQLLPARVDYYGSNVPYRKTEMYINSESSAHSSRSDTSSHMLHQPLSSSALPGQCLLHNRCLLPKKRKHFWRTYDNKVAIGISAEQYKNGESSSDSVSSSSSDVEYQNATATETVLKKRKSHCPVEHVVAACVAQGNVIQSNQSLGTVNTDIVTERNEGIDNCGFAPILDPVHVVETSEKFISEMKKSDIFGCTLKSIKPDLATIITVDDDNDDDDDVGYIYQESSKTYFELQTVKKNKTSDSVIGSTLSENHKLEIDHEANPNVQMLQAFKLNDINMFDSDGRIRLKESNVTNVDSKRIYIQSDDNVTESFDEAQNKLLSKDTKKGLCLNDLLEDIETESLKNGNVEINSSNRTKRNVIMLLQQCNHVKLQALDYLMSNVLIDDRHKSSTNRNQTIQKILNGDKIKTMNMLDIVELQVELGLS